MGEIATAETAGLIDLDWNDNSTILQMSTDHQKAGGGQFTLTPGNDYRLRMVVNQAKAATDDGPDGMANTADDVVGLPLILGKQGPLAIDLRDGFTFTTQAAGSTDQYPKVTSVTLGQSQSDQRAVVAGTPIEKRK